MVDIRTAGLRTKQVTFLWKAMSGLILRWLSETLPLYKAERREGQGKSSYSTEIIITHQRKGEGNVLSKADGVAREENRASLERKRKRHSSLSH